MLKRIPILLCLILVGCGASDAIDATKSMPAKMDGMRGDMAVTNNAIHKQTLLVALSDILKEENSRNLNPFPAGMFPGGKAFGEEATQQELVELTYLFLRDIAEITPDESKPLKDESGNFTAYAIEFDHQKMVKLNALMAIAAFTPQSTIEAIVANQIGERYEEDAYAFLALRTIAIKSFLLEQGLYAKKVTNPGKFDKALEYLKQIDYVAQLPFAEKVGIRTKGFLNQGLNIELVVKGGTDDTNIFGSYRNPKDLWDHAARSFETELEPQYQLDASLNPISSMSVHSLSRMRAIKSRIDEGVKAWAVVP